MQLECIGKQVKKCWMAWIQQRTKNTVPHCQLSLSRDSKILPMPLLISSSLSTPTCSLVRSEISIHPLSVDSESQTESLSLSLLPLYTADRISVANKYSAHAAQMLKRVGPRHSDIVDH